MTTLLILAAVGLIVNLIGRWIMIKEDDALPAAWRWVVALVPGAELIYILLRWERAKIGSVVCGLSFALALPMIGQVSLLIKSPTVENNSWLAAVWSQVFDREAERAKKEQTKAERERRITHKRAKLAELEAYLSKWYQMLEQRRAVLTDENSDETRVFNRDAAAYHGLLTASKAELAELHELSGASHN